jgi:hypothetical protein
MSIVSQILIGLLTTFIGFALGFTLQLSRRGINYWRARRFWRPFISGELKIVVGRFREFDTFEASGLVGVGDMQAAAEVVAFFAELGFRRRARAIEIVYQDRLAGDLYGANLICIGGPEGNRVTERILRRINHSIEFDGGTSLRDTETGTVYNPEFETGHEEQKALALDCGLLIKAPNPFDPRRTVMIVAACYGYGTWAGAALARSSQFLHTELVGQGEPIECLYKVEVIEEVPQIPNIIFTRRISS